LTRTPGGVEERDAELAAAKGRGLAEPVLLSWAAVPSIRPVETLFNADSTAAIDTAEPVGREIDRTILETFKKISKNAGSITLQQSN
jgi:hypothetical protein